MRTQTSAEAQKFGRCRLTSSCWSWRRTRRPASGGTFCLIMSAEPTVGKEKKTWNTFNGSQSKSRAARMLQQLTERR